MYKFTYMYARTYLRSIVYQVSDLDLEAKFSRLFPLERGQTDLETNLRDRGKRLEEITNLNGIGSLAYHYRTSQPGASMTTHLELLAHTFVRN